MEEYKGYVESLNLAEEVVHYDLVEQVVDLKSVKSVALSDVKFFKMLGWLNREEEQVYQSDVISVEDGSLYEVFEDGGQVKFHILNENLERTGEILNSGALLVGKQPKLEGNIFVLRKNLEESLAKMPKFNIEIVKEYVDGEIIYYYACNDKVEQQIDLIKVLFLGSKILKEEEYERLTFDYDSYNELIETKQLVKTSPQELLNYVLGVAYQEEMEEEDLEDVHEEEEQPLIDKITPKIILNLDKPNSKECANTNIDTEMEVRFKSEEVKQEWCEDCYEPVEECECEPW